MVAVVCGIAIAVLGESSENPSCAELQERNGHTELARDIYGELSANSTEAVRGSPESAPRVQARYRAGLTAAITSRLRAYCATQPDDQKPRSPVLREFSD